MTEKKQLDIFDFAINAERQGIRFYNKVAEKFDNKDLKELFQKLAREEAEHVKTFQKIKEKAQKKGEVAPFVFEDADVDEYVRSIILEGLFPSEEEADKQIESVETPASACAMAMQAEKNAILLYSELARLAKDREHKKVLEKLVREEKSHMVKLRHLRADFDPKYAAMAFGKFF